MLVTVGRVGRPHGIHGEVTVEVRTDEPDERFAPGSAVLVDGVPRHIAAAHWHGNRLLLRFDGVNDRTAAEELRNQMIEVERAFDAETNDPDAYYDSALLGCTVCDTTGHELGSVEEVVHLPGQDLLSVRLHDNRSVLIPFVDAIVPGVDLSARTITIDPPDGLLDPP